MAKYSVPALDKGLDILEALAAASYPQSLADLARTLDRSSSELFRMVGCLERRGYIVKDDGSGNYSLSLKLYELAHTHSPVDQLLRAADRPMKELAQNVRESCHLSVLSHGRLVVLAQAESPEPIRLSVEVGARFSPLHTVSGRLLLAYMNAEDRTILLEQEPEYRAWDETRRQELAAKMEHIHDSGYSCAEHETHLGVRDLAVPVGNPQIGLLAALAIPSLMAPGQPEDCMKLLAALRHCATTITETIGVSA